MRQLGCVIGGVQRLNVQALRGLPRGGTIGVLRVAGGVFPAMEISFVIGAEAIFEKSGKFVIVSLRQAKFAMNISQQLIGRAASETIIFNLVNRPWLAS